MAACTPAQLLHKVSAAQRQPAQPAHPGLAQNSTRNGQPLHLAARQLGAAVAQARCQPLGQALNDVQGLF